MLNPLPFLSGAGSLHDFPAPPPSPAGETPPANPAELADHWACFLRDGISLSNPWGSCGSQVLTSPEPWPKKGSVFVRWGVGLTTLLN